MNNDLDKKINIKLEFYSKENKYTTYLKINYYVVNMTKKMIKMLKV